MELIFPFLINVIIISFVVRESFAYRSHQYLFVKSKIAARQILKISKKISITNFNWIKPFETLSMDRKVELLNEDL